MAGLLSRSSCAGVLAGLLAVLALSGCGSEQTPISSANSKFKPADASIDASPADGASAPSDRGPAPIEEPDMQQADAAQGSKPRAGGPIKQPAAITVDKLDAASMPNGPPEAIIAYMQQMDGYEPRGITVDAQRADLVRVMNLMIEAGERALTHPEATEPQRVEAATRKLYAIMELAKRGEKNADQQLQAYLARLQKDKSPAVKRIGLMMHFSTEVAKLDNGEVKDPQQLVDLLRMLLEGDDEEHVLFLLGSRMAMTLAQHGHTEAAAEALTLVGNRYKGDSDEEVAVGARQLLKQVKLIELDFLGKRQALFEEPVDPKAPGELVAVMLELLRGSDVDRLEVDYGSHVADILERTEHYEEAQQVLAALDERFQSVEDEQLKAIVEEIVVNGRKRMALLGQTLSITGRTLDGQPLDTSRLQGKVVLIDFWATWCGPCLQEIPNIKRHYELYRDKGFEVIGYNLDERRSDLERFFATQKLPWPTVVSEDDERIGFNSPLADQCGVRSIPFLVLLDQNGKVVALHPQGDMLGKKLAELLGPVE